MKHIQTLSLIAAMAALAGCSTVKLPSLDVTNSSAFDEELQNIDRSIPDVAEAPQLPTDVRSTAAWDNSARELISVRDAYEKPFETDMEAEDLQAEFETLKQKAQAYKLDDPIDLDE